MTAKDNPAAPPGWKGRYVVLLFTLLLLLAAISIAEWLRFGGLVLTILTWAVLIGGVRAVAERRKVLVAAGVLGAVGFVASLAQLSGASKVVSVIGGVATILFLTLTATVVLAHVLRQRTIGVEVIAGAVSVYLLFGYIWANGFLLLDILHPDSIGGLEGSKYSMFRYFYFSFVTLTTLGYGDMVAMTTGARALAVLEALVGQLYLVVLVARLVAIQVAQIPRED